MHRFLLSSLVPSAATTHPDRVAVVCGDDSITWLEFEDRVGRLAGTLVEVGVGRGDRVGIYLHKSIESMVAVHGILRAGAAYVPIDPLAPVELIQSMVSDCGIQILVSHQPRKGGLAKLATNTELRAVIGLDSESLDSQPGASVPSVISWDDVASRDAVDPVVGVDDDLAYVMYTSGSTGRPKGMMHTHRSGMAYALMAADVYGLSPADRVANFSPLHFDMSTFEVLAGVGAGATAVLVPEPYLRVPASLTEYLADQRVTTLYTVPSLFMQMMARGALEQRDWSSVRWVMPAGEVFPPEPLARLMNLMPQAGFSNVYGPAEVNQCTHYHLPRPMQGLMPIGHASPGAEAELIDDGDQPIPGSGTGELIIRTATMMAGYWGRPDLDEKGFLFRDGPGGLQQRWYRTGDLVKRDADGLLHFLGRRDNQIKIRGNRVELEVVEAAVGSLDGIEQAVVGPRVDGNGDSVLVARYVPLAADEEAPIKQWRSALASTLPNYAVPTVFEAVSAFPKTASGKIDRRSSRGEINAPESP